MNRARMTGDFPENPPRVKHNLYKRSFLFSLTAHTITDVQGHRFMGLAVKAGGWIVLKAAVRIAGNAGLMRRPGLVVAAIP